MWLIKNRIRADKWHSQDLFIDSMVDKIFSAEYTIFYQDFIKSIYFLIGLKRFELDLVYTPIC